MALICTARNCKLMECWKLFKRLVPNEKWCFCFRWAPLLCSQKQRDASIKHTCWLSWRLGFWKVQKSAFTRELDVIVLAYETGWRDNIKPVTKILTVVVQQTCHATGMGHYGFDCVIWSVCFLSLSKCCVSLRAQLRGNWLSNWYSR